MIKSNFLILIVSLLLYACSQVSTLPPTVVISNNEAYNSADTINVTGVDSVADNQNIKLPQPIEISNPKPNTEFISAYISARALVKLLVSTSGAVSRAIIIKSDNESFNKYALEASMKSRFKPATANGTLINAWVYISFTYQRQR